MPRRGPTIAQTAHELIAERGPLTLEALTTEMVARERTRAKDPPASVYAGLERDATLVEGRDGRWYSLAIQLEGAVFTVAPTELERDEEIVLVREDLDLVARLVGGGAWFRDRHPAGPHLDLFGDYFRLPWSTERYLGEDEDGHALVDTSWDLREVIDQATVDKLLGLLHELGLERASDDEGLRAIVDELAMNELLHGPAGWLPKLRSREVLGFEVRDGGLHMVALDRRAMKGMHVEAAVLRVSRLTRAILDEETGIGAPAIPMSALLEIIATEEPDLFHKPLPPLGQLVERSGLEVDGGLVGLPGTAWDDIRWALDPNPEAAWGFEPGDRIN